MVVDVDVVPGFLEVGALVGEFLGGVDFVGEVAGEDGAEESADGIGEAVGGGLPGGFVGGFPGGGGVDVEEEVGEGGIGGGCGRFEEVVEDVCEVA